MSNMPQGAIESDLLGQLIHLAANPEFIVGDTSVRTNLLRILVGENPDVELAYVTDERGIQNVPNVMGAKIDLVYDGDGIGMDRSGRAWFHVPARLKRPFTSRKLISIATNRLCVTVAVPILTAEGALCGVLAVDMAVNE